MRGSDDRGLQLADPVSSPSLAEEQQAAEKRAYVEHDLEAAARRGSVPRGYGVRSEPPLPLTFTYDEDSQTAYIYIGYDREMRRGGQTRLDRGVVAHYDASGRIAGFEIIGVLAPGFEEAGDER